MKVNIFILTSNPQPPSPPISYVLYIRDMKKKREMRTYQLKLTDEQAKFIREKKEQDGINVSWLLSKALGMTGVM